MKINVSIKKNTLFSGCKLILTFIKSNILNELKSLRLSIII